MTKTLAIDTSTFVMGVAVTEGERTLGELMTNLKKNHSIRLMPAIKQLLEEVNITPQQLERIVVAEGPGSYTGVRIGVTTAKTLAWSLDIPLVGVSTLAVIAQGGYFFEGFVSPIIDARRGKVYTGLYKDGSPVSDDWARDRIILLEEWLETLARLDERVLFIGQDVKLHRAMIEAKLGEKAVFAPFSMHLPRPGELARLGQRLQPVPSIHSFVPNYHQLAEAEAKWRKAQK